MCATTLPTLLLGGDPCGHPDETYAEWAKALALPSVRGLVVGRALLYPLDDDVAQRRGHRRLAGQAGGDPMTRPATDLVLRAGVRRPTRLRRSTSRPSGPAGSTPACASSTLAAGCERTSCDTGDGRAARGSAGRWRLGPSRRRRRARARRAAERVRRPHRLRLRAAGTHRDDRLGARRAVRPVPAPATDRRLPFRYGRRRRRPGRAARRRPGRAGWSATSRTADAFDAGRSSPAR